MKKKVAQNTTKLPEIVLPFTSLKEGINFPAILANPSPRHTENIPI